MKYCEDCIHYEFILFSYCKLSRGYEFACKNDMLTITAMRGGPKSYFQPNTKFCGPDAQFYQPKLKFKIVENTNNESDT